MLTPIPQPPGLPILGNVFDVNPNNTWASLKGLAEKYGEIFQISVLGHKIVFVASAALAQEVCDEKRFRKYVGGPIVEIRYAVHDSLFTAYDHEASWGIAHRIIAPTLTPDVVRTQMFGEMNSLVTELFAKWGGLAAEGGKKNDVVLVNELNRLNLETTTYTLYGHKLNQLTTPTIHPMIKAMEDSTSEAIKRPTRPGFLNSLIYGSKFKKSTKAMRDYAAEIVAHRKAAIAANDAAAGAERKDMLHVLMNGKDPETGTAFTDSQVIDEIVTMPIGSSTAPCLLASAVYFLLQNPEVVIKAREELDRVTGGFGKDAEMTADHLDELDYTIGVLRESLRLACPAPGFNVEPIPREGAEKGDKTPVQLAGGKYAVAPDQAMIVVLAGVNRDPEVFDEPLKFKPERMMEENFETLPSGVKKWFGNGKRECIGKHWAWQFSFITLARMIRDIDFEAVNPNYEFKQDGWFNIRPINFHVRVKPRAAA